jgi:hypothetical protein
VCAGGGVLCLWHQQRQRLQAQFVARRHADSHGART